MIQSGRSRFLAFLAFFFILKFTKMSQNSSLSYDDKARNYYTSLKNIESLLYTLRKRMEERNEDDDEVFEGNVTFRF